MKQAMLVLAVSLCGAAALSQAQQTLAPFYTSQANTDIYVKMGQGNPYQTIAQATTKACTNPTAFTVILLPGANPSDTISGQTGVCNGAVLIDRTAAPAVTYKGNGTGYVAQGSGGGGPPTGAAGGDLNGSNYPNPQVSGLKGTQFCTGFTPTNGQAITLTTASSPNPCWTAATTASGVTWPTTGDLVLSNGTNSPAGLAPVNGDCAIGSGGIWTVAPCTGFANPMTTAGDLIAGGSSGTPQRLGIGSADQEFTVAGGAPAWAQARVGGNTLLDTPSTMKGHSVTDSIGLVLNGGFPEKEFALLGISSSNQQNNNIGSASLPDLLSCNTVPGCSAGGAYPYQIGAFPLTFPLGITANTTTVTNMGFNDLSNMRGGSGPTAAQLDYFQGGYRAWLIEWGIPDAQKLTPANCTQTSGTWVAQGAPWPPGTLFTTSAGAVMTCTGMNATDAGIISYKSTGDTSSTYTVTITNGGNTYSVTDPYTQSSTITQQGYYGSAWGGNFNLYAIGQSGLAGGLTTITFTTGGNCSANCVFVAPYFLSKSISQQNAPKVEVALVTYECGNGTCSGGAGHTDAQTDTIRTEELKVIKELHDNGLNITSFDPSAPITGFNANVLAQTGHVYNYTISAGGSGYANSNVTFSGGGCTIPPTATAAYSLAPVSGGVITTGSYTLTTPGGGCTSAPTVNFTGGGIGAAATATFAGPDAIHPNDIGGQNYANLGAAQINSAVAVQDRDAHTEGVSYVNGSLFAGPVPPSGITSDSGLVPFQQGVVNSNTQPSTGSLQTGRFSGGDGRSWLERVPDAGGNHVWQFGSADSELTDVGSARTYTASTSASNVEAFVLGSAPGVQPVSYGCWTTGNSSGLPGACGWYDNAGHFLMNTCSPAGSPTDDIFGYTPVSGGNVCAGTGSTWKILGPQGAAYFAAYNTTGNCSSNASPAVCGAAAAGSVAVPAGGTTLVVNTSAVTIDSQVQLTFDSSLGTRLGVTCNTSIQQPTVSARSAGTSFTITVPASISTNPDCVSYTITN